MQHHWEIVRDRLTVAANTPEELFKQACDYFAWCDNNPIEVQRTITVGKAVGTSYTDKQIRPYNLKALCLHTGTTEEYIRDIRNTKDTTSQYYHVISRILYIIYVQNHELATVGVFNPVFTARVLNLGVDDTPSSAIKVEVINSNMELSTSENEVLEKLEAEKSDSIVVEFVKS